MMKLPPVYCPGCGQEMELSTPQQHMNTIIGRSEFICGYDCPKMGCRWKAPTGVGRNEREAMTDAWEKAMKRTKPEDNDEVD